MHKRIILTIVLFLLYLNYSRTEEITQEVILIVNKESSLTSINRLDLYKLFNNSNNNSYKLTCLYMKDSEKNTEQYKKLESFVQYALDDKDMTLVSYKAISLNKIRKRDTVKITTFKISSAEIIKEVMDNKNIIGVIFKSELVDAKVNICSLNI